MNTKDFADIKHMSIIDYIKYDQQEWPAWRKRIAALREDARAHGDQEMVDLCYLADSGEDEDAVATVVQYLDDIAEEAAADAAAIKIGSISREAVHCEIAGRAPASMSWAALRDAASARNADDLRAIYTPLLREARARADRAGLIGRRLTLGGAAHTQVGETSDYHRGRLMSLARREGWDWARESMITVEVLDPDQVDEALGPEGAASTADA